MTEILHITSPEKEQLLSHTSAEAQKENAGAASQLDASLRASQKVSRLRTLRVSTDDVETEASRQQKKVIRQDQVGESIDV